MENEFIDIQIFTEGRVDCSQTVILDPKFSKHTEINLVDLTAAGISRLVEPFSGRSGRLPRPVVAGYSSSTTSGFLIFVDADNTDAPEGHRTRLNLNMVEPGTGCLM